MTDSERPAPQQPLVKRLRDCAVLLGEEYAPGMYHAAMEAAERLEVAQSLLDRARERGELSEEERLALISPSSETALLRQLVLDCQADLAAYLPPDSGIGAYDVVNTLLGRLDGPQARAALGVAERFERPSSK